MVNPEEVLLIVIEDYVTPEEIATAFEDSGLMEFVYTGSFTPLADAAAMILAGGRVMVFTESGNRACDWLHPAFASIQETPYTFHTPEEFSCKPNRGGTRRALPDQPLDRDHAGPRPSNAMIVNTYDLLLKRARGILKGNGTQAHVHRRGLRGHR